MSDVPDVTGIGDRLETLTDATMKVSQKIHAQGHQLARVELAIAVFAVVAFAFYFARTGVKA